MRTLATPDHACGAGPPLTAAPAQVFIDTGSTQAARKHRRVTVTAFTTTFIDVTGWAQAPLARRLGAPGQVRAFAAWLVLATTSPVDAAYVAACGTAWGRHAALVHTDLATTFTRTANQLGYTAQQTTRQWATLAKLVAISGHRPEDLHRDRYDAARHELTTAIAARHGGHAPITLTTPLHGLESTLTVLRILDVPTARSGHASTRAGHWDTLATSTPMLIATMRRYLSQLALSMRPGTVALIDTTLRHLASYLSEHHEGLSTVADIERTHIEGFKAWLNARPGYRGRRDPVKTTIGMRMSHLRCFFDRIIEWGYPDVPARNLVFAGDMPLRDRPLPRFLDDADAAALLSAARALPQLFDRVCVEVLARTGLRKGEFLGLTTDAVVQIGEGHWLRTPVGKLRTDRYVPLHPKVKTLLEEWALHRGEQPTS